MRRRAGSDGARRAEESVRALEAGGLPSAARDRLANLSGAYTSNLSAAEFLLLREAGLRPLTQVMGSCFYRIGTQYMPGASRPLTGAVKEGLSTPGAYSSSGFEYDTLGRRIYTRAAFGQVFELDVATEAWREARRLALGRLAEEARLAGADAVVGVSLRRGERGLGRSLIEFAAVGTAVASERYDLGDDPVLSSLSGQDFAKLWANGYWPAGLVVSTSVVYVMTGWQQRQRRGVFAPNTELLDYTQGVQYARGVALARLERDARAAGAAGIVGLQLEVTQDEHEHHGSWSSKQNDMIVTAHALGTAIVQLDRRVEERSIRLALSLG